MLMLPRVFYASLLLVLVSAALSSAEHWAVIVVGSRGYDNYRHQADACHAYHVVRRHGIPEENVILMMYDDVASAPENPFKGRLFNKPTTNDTHGSGAIEVYEGCKVDYRGDDVTPEAFLAVLAGDSKASKGKKVLGSGADDRVFVNFVDHGARGVLIFPHGQLLTAKQLTTTLEKMHAAKRYKELVFYIEACHSGSMFWSWSMSRINAFVTTAANGWESSWGTYCPPEDKVNGVEMNTCLGDLYSVNWMEDSDRTDLSGETLRDQYQLVKKETKMSHVEAFGSTKVRREIVGNFQSNYDNEPTDTSSNSVAQSLSASAVNSAVAAPDVPLLLEFYRYLRTAPGRQRQARADSLIASIKQRELADQIFSSIGESLAIVGLSTTSENNFEASSDCVEQTFELFGSVFGDMLDSDSDIGRGLSSYSLQHTTLFSELCASLNGKLDAIRTVLQAAHSAHIEAPTTSAL
ncbi:hypothetical protein PINS_up008290 [Pythium insidiosum]|nr:hypothetical protein PINS_up008290 [Pythium insidiosum]